MPQFKAFYLSIMHTVSAVHSSIMSIAEEILFRQLKAFYYNIMLMVEGISMIHHAYY
jgi:hypothetical protein